MLLARIFQFLLGAAFSAGGGYLVWAYRAEIDQLFPPGPEGLPILLVAGIGGLSLGVVFLVSALAPRPRQTARLQEAASRRAEALKAADAYYAERARAADRDWRSGKLPPHTPSSAPESAPLFAAEPVSEAGPTPEPLFEAEPARVLAPERKSDPLFEPEPGQAVEQAPTPDSLFDPEPAQDAELESRAEAPAMDLARPAAEPATRQPAGKPVATSVPPAQMLFPAAATLSPIPKSSDSPPHPVGAPSSAPVETAATVQAAASASMPVGDAPETDQGFGEIRAAIREGRLEEADRLLNISRESATGLALAELTGLAGDHAAAAGRLSNAKWLWRLALKRFGEAGALDTPAARRVSDRLRLAGQ